MLRRLPLLLLAVSSLCSPGLAEAWTRVAHPAQQQGEALAIVRHPSGDRIVGGWYTDPNVRFTVLRLDAATGAERWHAPRTLEGTARALALDPDGNVIAAGSTHTGLLVVKLDGDDGHLLWSYALPGLAPNDHAVHAVAVDASGDVVAAGHFTDRSESGFADVFVVKLAGADGSERWRRRIDGPLGVGDDALALGLDAAGDVVIAGAFEIDLIDETFFGRPFVQKLAGSDGHELWSVLQTSFGSVGRNRALVVDSAGDVTAVGYVGESFASRTLSVRALAGADGSERWRRVLGPGDALAVTTDATGDPVVGGMLDGKAAVLAFDRADGSERWRRGEDPSCADLGSVNALAVDPDGDVIAAGGYAAAGIAIQRLRGTTGDRIECQTAAGPTPLFVDQAHGVVADRGGVVTVAATLAIQPYRREFFVIGLADRVRGERLAFHESSGHGALRATLADPLLFPGTGIAAELAAVGASLTLANPSTGESQTFPLPPAGWIAVASALPPGERYEYRDAKHRFGPCTRVIIDHAGRVRARCQSADFAFSLDEPAQGSLAVRFAIGAGGPSYCAEFGGTVRVDRRGLFRSINAPAPTECPIESASRPGT